MIVANPAGFRVWIAIVAGMLVLAGCGQPEGSAQPAQSEPAREVAAEVDQAAADESAEVAAETAAAEAEEDTDESEAAADEPGGGEEVITELKIIDTLAGDGPTAEAGQTVIVHYTGWLYDPSQPENKGSKFDSSVDRGQPFAFPLGAGRVIQGWDQGFGGMQVGGKRTLIIPPDMGYGSRGAGAAIPPDSTLLFEVELLGVQ